MSLLADIAVEHQAQRIRLSRAAAARAGVLWSRMDADALDASWDVIAPQLTAEIVARQMSSASAATQYLARVGSASAVRQDPATLAPAEFGGYTYDGREVGPAMFGAVTTTKRAIGSGVAPRLALESGMAFLGVIVKAAIADAGRAADAALATGKGYTRYVRVVNPGACSRCAILAGSDRFSKPFLRHPACKCTSLPIRGDERAPKGVFDSPTDYFESLSKAEQDRVFTKDGAEAIRLGADPVQVVNARRGAYQRPGRRNELGFDANGKPIKVLATETGTSYRGAYGRLEFDRASANLTKGAGDRYRRTINPRLMPETILQIARDDQELAKALLRQYGYLR